MKKDIKNVVITFSLVAVMLVCGSFFYNQKVFAKDQATAHMSQKQQQQNLQSQQALQAQFEKINAEQERRLSAQKALQIQTNTSSAKPVTASGTTTLVTSGDAVAAVKALLVKQQADALAYQQALQQIAQQQALAQAQASSQQSRRSRAS